MNQITSPPDTLDVLILGAGFGGVCAAIKLQERGIDNFRVYDKAAGIGGTWWHNTYPGAACDIESHLYCYSFEPNPDWSRRYSPQPEIQAYIERCAHKYGVADRIELNRELRSLRFENDLWVALFSDGATVLARHVIFATGGLHQPAFPDLPGRELFNGPSMHTAQWDHSVDFGGRRVAIIGSAASAIQALPELARVASHIDLYQRTPNYIAPRRDHRFSPRQQAMFRRWPWLNRLYRRYIFLRSEYILFPVVATAGRSRWRDFLQGMVGRHIRRSVNDPALASRLVPDYPLGCKRILIADDFYAALNRDNVSLVTEGIAAVEADGLRLADGSHRPADIIVYATGFDIEGYLHAIDIHDRNGELLADRWQDGPVLYRGGFVPGLPNFYMTTGPNTGVGTTSVVMMIEAQMELILQAIEAAGDSRLVEVTEAAAAQYTRDIQQALGDTVWATGCHSWYKREDGSNYTLYPHDGRSWIRDHRQLEGAHFRFTEARRATLA